MMTIAFNRLVKEGLLLKVNEYTAILYSRAIPFSAFRLYVLSIQSLHNIYYNILRILNAYYINA